MCCNANKRRYNIPVLSGSAYVGQLYDGKTDQLLYDRFFWSNIVTRQNNMTNVFYETKTEETQMDRLNNVGLDASLKLSFLSGLISVRAKSK